MTSDFWSSFKVRIRGALIKDSLRTASPQSDIANTLDLLEASKIKILNKQRSEVDAEDAQSIGSEETK